jgi:hypothetical protein
MQGDTLIECDPEFLDVDVATVTAIESAQFSYPVPPKDCDEYDRVRFERVYERAKKRAGSLVEITLMITRKAKC